MKNIKVLGIDGSPRENSNTLSLLKIAIKSAEEEGAESTLIRLREYNIPYCRGCISYNGKCNLQECTIQDGEDVKVILETMIISDVILFATPVYWFGPSGLMKNLIDRMTSLEHKQKLLDGKVTGILCSYEEEGAANTISQFFLTLSDMGLVFPPYAYTYNRKGEKDPATIFYAKQLGKNSVRMAKLIKEKKWWNIIKD